MMRLTRKWVAGAGALVVAGLVWGAAHAHSVKPREAAGLRQEPQPSAETLGERSTNRSAEVNEINRLAARLSSLESQLAEARSHAEQQGKEKEKKQDAPEDKAGSLEEALAADARLSQSFDDHMKSEPLDPAWNKEMADRLQGYFHAPGAAGSTLERTECRSTMCRVEVANNDVKAKKSFIDGVSSMIPPHAQGFARMERLEDGKEGLNVVVYFTREGHQLPMSEL